MLQALRKADERWRQLETELADPAILADPSAYTARWKEYRSMETLIRTYRDYLRCAEESAQAQELLAQSDDPELRALAEEEIRLCRARSEELTRELQLLLIPEDPLDHRNILLEIRAGAGGEEAALFAALLYRMYAMYAARRGFRVSPIRIHETELGGIKELVCAVEGEGAYSRFRMESGVHRIQRVPVTESNGKLQTSTATVAVLPEAEAVEVEIRPEDVVLESCKSSGAGGQHINKTESAVRLTHKPTGIVVECQEERSQFQNRERAMQLLRAKLYRIKQEEQDAQITSARRSQVGTGDRSERIRTYHLVQGRITDHRIGKTLYDVDSFLNGDLDPLLDALLAADTAERLQAASGNEPF
jgi:peptide chain release factor 1